MKYLFPLLLFIIAINTSCKPEKIDDPIGTNSINLNYTTSTSGWGITLYQGLDQTPTVSRCPYVFVKFGIWDTDLNFIFWTKQGTDNSFADWCGNIPGAGGEMVNIGAVKGLGEVNIKPTSGWTDKTSVEIGHGYVLRFKNTFDYSNSSLEYVYYRVYVEEWIESTTGGILGAKVKYQGPF